MTVFFYLFSQTQKAAMRSPLPPVHDGNVTFLPVADAWSPRLSGPCSDAWLYLCTRNYVQRMMDEGGGRNPQSAQLTHHRTPANLLSPSFIHTLLRLFLFCYISYPIINLSLVNTFLQPSSSFLPPVPSLLSPSLEWILAELGFWRPPNRSTIKGDNLL